MATERERGTASEVRAGRRLWAAQPPPPLHKRGPGYTAGPEAPCAVPESLTAASGESLTIPAEQPPGPAPGGPCPARGAGWKPPPALDCPCGLVRSAALPWGGSSDGLSLGPAWDGLRGSELTFESSGFLFKGTINLILLKILYLLLLQVLHRYYCS